MNWADVILAVLGLGFVGDVIVRLIFKSNRRIENAKADNAEIEVAKNKAIAEAEAKSAMEAQYEERIKDLHKTIDKLNEQLDASVTRDVEKEKRFVEQTNVLRDVQRECLAIEKEKGEMEVKYLKRIAELELELEKKRCDDTPCPFRQPPNAYTQPKAGLTKESYHENKKNAKTTLQHTVG